MAQPGEHRFSRGSPVGRFWLARCTGFRAFAGRHELGTVVEIGFASHEGDVRALVVTRGLRRKVIPVERVLQIDPWSETVLLARRRTHRTRRVFAATASAERTVSHGFRRYGHATAVAVLAGMTAAARGSARGIVWAAPRARRLAAFVLRMVATAVFVAFIVTGLLLRLAVAALSAAWPYVVRAADAVRAAGAHVLDAMSQRAASRAASRSTSRRRPV